MASVPSDMGTPMDPLSVDKAAFAGFVSQQAKERFESRFWTKSYPPGVPMEMGAVKHNSLLELFEEQFKNFASRVAFVSAGCEMTYKSADEKSTQLAAYFQSVGIKQGDRIAIMLPNVLQMPVTLAAVLKVGGVVSMVNPLYTPRELNHQLKDTGAETIVVFENFGHTLQQSLEGTQVKRIIITQLGDILQDGLNLKGRLINFVMRRVNKMVPAYSLPGAVWFKTALSKGRGRSVARPNLTLDDIALLQYTGGTTGVSKGAMLTHRNLLSNLEQGLAYMGPALGDGPHTVLTLLPLYHVYALAINFMLFFTQGARNILIANPRDINRVVGLIRGEKISALTAVNTLYNAFLNNEEFCKRDFSDLKFAMSGGMALQRAIAERWHAVTGVPILEGFGMTETSPVVSVPPVHGADLPVFRGNVGLPIPSTEVRLRGDTGLWVDINTPGEICVRGPQVMKGYWKRPEATADMIDSDGWLATGDIGVMDEEGFIKIVDRKKDMIIVSGFNVFPNEIEDVVAMHPGVLEVGVVGMPDEITGEKIKLCVVKRDPNLTAEEVMAHCRKHLTGYKVPKLVEFWTEIPKTNVGKILRRELRDKKPS